MQTGMVLVGSSIFSGLFAIGMFTVAHRLFHNTNVGDISIFSDMSKPSLSNLVNNSKEIRVVRERKKHAILHHGVRESLSHVEVHHKDGSVTKIIPKNNHEKEALQNKISTLESKLSYHGLPNIVWKDVKQNTNEDFQNIL